MDGMRETTRIDVTKLVPEGSDAVLKNLYKIQVFVLPRPNLQF
jgi:hypothetical protein